MTSTPILKFPDFNKQFEIETDACLVGLRAVLLQEKHPIAYFSRKIFGNLKEASIYVKEIQTIIQAVSKWRHYLLGSKFVIKIDHKTLKNLLSQVIQTPYRQIFMCKLLGFKYSTEYKSGKDNVVANALSKLVEEPNDDNSEDEGVSEGSI